MNLRKTALGMAVLLAALGLAYMQAASMLSFRLWMGNRNLQSEDYVSAILWYTRALRSAEESGDSVRSAEVSSALYRAYEGFCRWEFEGASMGGWFAGNQIDELLLTQGTLEIRSLGDNPWLEIIRLRLAPERSYRFQARLRASVGAKAQLYWAPLTDVFTADDFTQIPLIPDGQWRDYTLEMKPLKKEIGKLRFIPVDAAGRIAIDYIRIFPADR